MGKTFDLSKKSDMKRLEKEIINQAKKQISSKGIEIDCPKCKHPFKALPGENICPKCGASIDLDFK